jgi:exonuclease SbcD
MKTPIAILSSDWHISKSNYEEIIDLINQKIELAKSLKVKRLYCLGDVFNSRNAQELVVLKAFSDILDNIQDADLELHCISGNHDKVGLNNKYSYLDPYRHHPAMNLHDTVVDEYMGVNIAMIPYFEEEFYLSNIKQINLIIEEQFPESPSILLTHQGLNGVKNNDGSEVQNSLTGNLFSGFKQVFVGHYHDISEQGNIRYIGSLKQNNFGEDSDKGFTILYDDCSFEFVRSNFKAYTKIQIDSKTSIEEINSIIKQNNNSNNHLRLEFIGNQEEVKAIQKSLDVDMIRNLGVDVKFKSDKEFENEEINFETEINTEITKAEILGEFNKFTESTSLNREIGLKYLKQAI